MEELVTIPFAISFGPVAIFLGVLMIACASFFSMPSIKTKIRSTSNSVKNLGATRQEELLITVDGEEFTIRLADPTETDALEIEKALVALRKDRTSKTKSG